TGITASGSIANLAAGSADSSSLSVALITTSAGAQNGTAAISYTSKAVAGSGLSNTVLTGTLVNVTGGVYAYATPGTLAGTLNLGSFHVGDAGSSALLISNTTAAGAFSAGFAPSFASPTGITASGSIANLAAGSSDNSSMSV